MSSTTTSSAGITWPYLRRMRLTLTGLAGASGQKIYESDGTQNHLRITATVNKHIQSAAAVSQIQLFNLSPDVRNLFRRSETKVRLEAGWDHGPRRELREVFFGSLLIATTSRAGPDLVTQLYVQSGRDRSATTLINKPWRGGMPIRNIVLDIAKSLPNVEVDPVMVTGITAVADSRGWVFSTSAEKALDQLGRAYGFYWSIIDGKFQTVGKMPKEGIGHAGVLRSPDLIEAAAALAGAKRHQTGITAKSVFEPTLKPGMMVTIASTVDPLVNGEWRIHELAHRLDCFSPASFATEFSAYARRKS